MARRKDGLYKRAYDILGFRYKDAAGAWREKSTGTADRKEAKRKRQKFLQELAGDRLPTEMADWRISQAEEWWNEYRRPRIAEGTNRSEPYIMRHLCRILGDKRLREITNGELDRYVTARLAGYQYQDVDGRRTKMASAGPWSINKEMRLWSAILRKAKLWHRLADDYRPLKTKVSDIGQALTRPQLQHLSAVAESKPAWEAAFYGSVLAVNTGVRGGEIKKLTIGAIDLDRRRIRIRRSDAKTDASARAVELNRDACEAAARLLLRAESLGCNRPGHYLMPKDLSRITHGINRGQRGYDPTQHQDSWDTAWARLTEAAGFPTLRFHDLRHTFISHMVEKGIPIGVVQSMVGHISARMLRHYTHVTTGAVRKAVDMLDEQPMLAPSLTAAGREKKGEIIQ